MDIDYNRINEAIRFYSNYGYKYINLDWTVTEYIDTVTRPKNT